MDLTFYLTNLNENDFIEFLNLHCKAKYNFVNFTQNYMVIDKLDYELNVVYLNAQKPKIKEHVKKLLEELHESY